MRRGDSFPNFGMLGSCAGVFAVRNDVPEVTCLVSGHRQSPYTISPHQKRATPTVSKRRGKLGTFLFVFRIGNRGLRKKNPAHNFAFNHVT